MIYVIPMTTKIACAFLDTNRSEATFIFSSGYDLNVTKGLFGDVVPEGGKSKQGETTEAHVSYHNLLQTQYNTTVVNPPLDCSDKAPHGHYLVDDEKKCATFYMAFFLKQSAFGLSKALFGPGGAFVSFSPPQGL
jgi:hypothetical protein